MGSLNIDIADLLSQLRSIATSLASIADSLNGLGSTAQPLVVEATVELSENFSGEEVPIPVKVSF